MRVDDQLLIFVSEKQKINQANPHIRPFPQTEIEHQGASL
jgi:hypothetical protein